MKTPIYDFLRGYKKGGVSRFHMPGHKGRGALGIEGLDVTEVNGADVLYHASGIIAESEEYATRLFGTAHTYYSTEGSTLAIKAMLAIIAREAGLGATVLAARNVHKAFVYGVGELDLGVEWIYPSIGEHLCRCSVTPDDVAKAIAAMDTPPAAVYITTPDYLGGMLDVRGIAEVCKRYGVPLLVDNAHGAYLAFCEPSLHPMHVGAAMCADSAHKTLPVLTGGAYLHIAKGYERYTEGARDCLSIFASTSPSYLTLASLDLCNAYLDGKAAEAITKCKEKVTSIKALSARLDQDISCDEPMKIAIDAARFGYTGATLSAFLRERRIECEYADGEYVVLMASPANTRRDYRRLKRALGEIINENRTALPREDCGKITHPRRASSIRAALLAPQEQIPVEDALGRICASPTVSCPPAIPILVSGEVVDESAIALFKKYGIDTVSVVK